MVDSAHDTNCSLVWLAAVSQLIVSVFFIYLTIAITQTFMPLSNKHFPRPCFIDEQKENVIVLSFYSILFYTVLWEREAERESETIHCQRQYLCFCVYVSMRGQRVSWCRKWINGFYLSTREQITTRLTNAIDLNERRHTFVDADKFISYKADTDFSFNRLYFYIEHIL